VNAPSVQQRWKRDAARSKSTVPTTMAEREETTRGGNGGGRSGSAGPGLGEKTGAFFSGLLERPRQFKQFVHETRAELNHVSWPSWDDVKSTTSVVILCVFVFAVFLFGIDFGVSRAVQWMLGAFR
jgi:preprotein translocase subunit SecE